jgi:Na+-driven multidrug efflux pump
MPEFKASLDVQSKIITSVLAPVFLLVPWFILSTILQGTKDTKYQSVFIFLGVTLAVLFVFTFLLSPTRYIIENKKLTIKTRIKDFTYNLEHLKKSGAITKSEMGFLIRVFGNGGIFGYTGFFTSKVFGRMQFWVTNSSKLILLELANNKKVVLSPDDTEGFLKSIKPK